MKTSHIPLESFIPKSKNKVKIENDAFHIPAKETDLGKVRHHVSIPGKYQLPFRIDMRVNTTFVNTQPSQFTVYVGKGRVYFNGGRIAAGDILLGGRRVLGDDGSPYYVYYNHIPEKDFVDISITYTSQAMYVTVDNKICYASKEMPYLQLLQDNEIPDELTDGLEIALRSGTHTATVIKSLTVTEYENDKPDIPTEIADLPEMSEFELFVRGLPPEVHDEVFKTDDYLLNEMHNSLKFRRTFNKNEHLLYRSSAGFQYQIPEYGVRGHHQTYWVQSAKKPDRTDEIFGKLAESSSEFAEKIFKKLEICNPHSRVCKQRTKVKLKSKLVNVCMGKTNYKMLPEEFENVRKVVAAASEVVKAAGK